MRMRNKDISCRARLRSSPEGEKYTREENSVQSRRPRGDIVGGINSIRHGAIHTGIRLLTALAAVPAMPLISPALNILNF